VVLMTSSMVPKPVFSQFAAFLHYHWSVNRIQTVQ